jgi:hypothetical protein
MVGLAVEHCEQKSVMIDRTYFKAHRTGSGMTPSRNQSGERDVSGSIVLAAIALTTDRNMHPEVNSGEGRGESRTAEKLAVIKSAVTRSEAYIQRPAIGTSLLRKF